jgi:hypothetical protein
MQFGQTGRECFRLVEMGIRVIVVPVLHGGEAGIDRLQQCLWVIEARDGRRRRGQQQGDHRYQYAGEAHQLNQKA